jgi:hypothetical protein
MNSHLARISHPVSDDGPDKRTSGVLPISESASGATFVIPQDIGGPSRRRNAALFHANKAQLDHVVRRKMP